MPFVDLEPLPLGTAIGRPENAAVTPTPPEKPSVGWDEMWTKLHRGEYDEVLGATFRRENILGSFATYHAARMLADGIDSTPDPDFKVWDNLKGTPYERHFDSFLEVRNRAQFDVVRRRIDQ